jgi:hypothetical protein
MIILKSKRLMLKLMGLGTNLNQFLDELVQGLMHLGIGFTHHFPDYAILPVIYSINLLGFERGLSIDYPNEYGVFGLVIGRIQHNNLITFGSCIVHAEICESPKMCILVHQK